MTNSTEVQSRSVNAFNHHFDYSYPSAIIHLLYTYT